MVIEELYAELGFTFDKAAFDEAEKKLHGLNETLAAMGAFVIGVGAGFIAMVSHITDEGVEISRTAAKVGLSTDALQEFRDAGELAGVSSDSLTAGLAHLNRTMYEASVGSAEAAFALYQVGGRGKNTEETLYRIADTLGKMPDGFRKTALAQEVFGRGGKDMIPLLKLGRSGIRDLIDAVRDYGTTMDHEAIQKSLEAEASTKKFEMAMKGLRNTIFGRNIGMWNELRDKFTKWIVANRQWIALGVSKVFQAMIVVARHLVDIIKIATIAFLAFRGAMIAVWISSMVTTAGGLIPLVGWLGAAAMAALRAAGSFLLASLPFIGWAAAIAFVLLALEDLYVYLEGGNSVIGNFLEPAFKKFWHEQLPKWIQEAKDTVTNFYTTLFDLTERWLEQAIPGYAKVANYLGGLRDKLADTVGADAMHSDASHPGAAWLIGNGVQTAGTATYSADPSAGPNFSSSSGASIQVNTGDIIVQGAHDPHRTAKAVREELQKQANNAHAALAPSKRRNN